MTAKILVAEDYEDTRVLMKFMLETFGFEVIEAADGVQAIEEFNRHKPDLILMDIAMPEMNGIEATKAIRNLERTNKIPIVCVTAHGNSFYEEAIRAGCNDLVGKPLDFDSFEALIKKHLIK